MVFTESSRSLNMADNNNAVLQRCKIYLVFENSLFIKSH